MTETQKILFQQRVNEILYYLWDPVGVNSAGPETRNEYDSYSNRIWKMAIEGRTKTDLAGYLTEIATNDLKLDPHTELDDFIAKLILDWKSYFENSLNT